jgi:hypothetical protein
LGFHGHAATTGLVLSHYGLQVIDVKGVDLLQLIHIGVDVEGHRNIKQHQRPGHQRNGQVIPMQHGFGGGGAGKHHVRAHRIHHGIEGAGLNVGILKLAGQFVGPPDGAIEDGNLAGVFGQQVLSQQASHFPSPKMVTRQPLRLGTFNRANSTAAELMDTAPVPMLVSVRTRLPARNGLLEQAVENAPGTLVLLGQLMGVLDLGQNLAFPQHQTVEASGNPHQVGDGILVQQNKQVLAQFVEGQAAVL